ncbi:hypothetical protein CK203_046368 [Vitis vinifera]|uniref:Uncharacterized protein n=1 Tax=Vitis vinifera TaxID=29760 RepID=A0A438FW67_VITVI|nr:hypothetical protein CK203_046368 [Vitis vinifera]
MEGDSSFSAMAPPVFNGDNYTIWVVRMEAYLDVVDLWGLLKMTMTFLRYQTTQRWLKSRITWKGKLESPRQKLAYLHQSNKNKAGSSKGKYPPCKHCDRTGHSPFKRWKRPDAKCNKCNQLGHEAIICKNQNQQQDADAQIANEDESDHLFVATCFSGSISSDSWLIDSGCTNHMTHDKELFKELKPTRIARVRIGHGGHILAKGIGTVSMATHLEMVEGIPEFEVISTSYQACQYGKQSRLPFPTTTWRASNKLQLIHTDVGGPQRTPSLKGLGIWLLIGKVPLGDSTPLSPTKVSTD